MTYPSGYVQNSRIPTKSILTIVAQLLDCTTQSSISFSTTVQHFIERHLLTGPAQPTTAQHKCLDVGHASVTVSQHWVGGYIETAQCVKWQEKQTFQVLLVWIKHQLSTGQNLIRLLTYSFLYLSTYLESYKKILKCKF